VVKILAEGRGVLGKSKRRKVGQGYDGGGGGKENIGEGEQDRQSHSWRRPLKKERTAKKTKKFWQRETKKMEISKLQLIIMERSNT